MLSVIIVGMIVFLVPTLIEEAQAKINAGAVSFVGPFSDVKSEMSKGCFHERPVATGNVIHWETSNCRVYGDERGTVEANVGDLGKVKFFFSNPANGTNTCSTESASPSLFVGCYIFQGVYADATFLVGLPVSQKGSNNFCDMLLKFGGEQIKTIREKLPC